VSPPPYCFPWLLALPFFLVLATLRLTSTGLLSHVVSANLTLRSHPVLCYGCVSLSSYIRAMNKAEFARELTLFFLSPDLQPRSARSRSPLFASEDLPPTHQSREGAPHRGWPDLCLGRRSAKNILASPFSQNIRTFCDCRPTPSFIFTAETQMQRWTDGRRWSCCTYISL
jgi:hypothetical protein